MESTSSEDFCEHSQNVKAGFEKVGSNFESIPAVKCYQIVSMLREICHQCRATDSRKWIAATPVFSNYVLISQHHHIGARPSLATVLPLSGVVIITFIVRFLSNKVFLVEVCVLSFYNVIEY